MLAKGSRSSLPYQANDGHERQAGLPLAARLLDFKSYRNMRVPAFTRSRANEKDATDMKRFASFAAAILLLTLLSGCAVVAVADAAITVGATVVKVGAKAVGAAVDAVTPDSSSKDKKK